MTRLLIALALVGVSSAASAEHNCAPRDSALKQLSEKWGETRRTVMLGRGMVYETYASDDSGTWTVLATDARGRSCIIASGVAYEEVSEAAGDPA